MTHSHPERARLWRRRLVRLLGGLALAGVVLVALVALTVNLPSVRARIARETSVLVSEEIVGTLAITAIGGISLSPINGVHVSGIDAELLDASRERVLAVSGVQANLDVSQLLASLIGGSPLTLSFAQVGIVHAEALLIEEPDGEPSLVSALEPVPSRTPEGAGEQTAPLPFMLYFEDVTLERGSARGTLGGIPDLELEVSELTGRASVDRQEVRFELRQLAVWVRNVPALRELRGELSASVALGIGGPEGEPLALETAGEFRGSMAGVPLRAEAHYSEGHLSGYARVDEATSAELERFWPDAAFGEPISSLLAVDGPIERLQVTAVLRSRGGNVYTTGSVALSPVVSGRLSVFGAKLNAGWWLPDAPQSSIQMAAASTFELEDGALSARVAQRTWSSTLAGRALPDLRVSARLTPRLLDASVRTDVHGAQLMAQVRMARLQVPDKDTQLELKIEATVASLAQASRALSLDAELAGGARLEASGRVTLGALPSLSGGRLSASFERASAGSIGVERATLSASGEGPLLNPRLLFSLAAVRLAIPHYPIERVSVNGRGNLHEVSIDADIKPKRAPLTRVTLRVSPVEKRVADLAMVMGRGQLMVSASAQRLRLTPSGFELRQLEVRGPGQLKVDASLAGDRLRVSGSTSELDAAALLERVGFDLELPHSLADLRVRVDYRPGHMSGQVQGTVTEISRGKLRGGSLEADLELHDDRVDGTASLRLAPFGEARLRAEALRLPPRWTAKELSRMSGQMELQGSADLEELQAIVSPDWLPDLQANGRLESRLNIAREPGGPPKISLAVSTEDLTWLVPDASDGADSPEEAALRPTGVRWEGMDVELTAEIVRSRLESRVTIVDPHGAIIADLRGATQLPLDQLLTNPKAFQPGELPIDLQLQVPERQLAAFPPLLRPHGLVGSFGAQLTAIGSVGRPELSAQLKLEQLRREGSPRARPLAITADARLLGEQLEAVVRVGDEKGKLLSMLANARLTGGGRAPSLRGLDVELRSNGVPLESLGGLLGYELGGELYGSLLAKDVAGNPTLQGTLWVNEPSFDGFRQKRARWTIQADADSFETELVVEQKLGQVHASASGPWRWRDQLAPQLQPKDSRVSLQAKSFELRALRPLLPEQVRALSGLLDAELNSDPGPQRDVTGTIRMRDGMVHVSELGQAFHDVNLHVTLGPQGSVQIQKIAARGLRGSVIVSGELDLDGLVVRSGQLTLRIPRADPLPIMFEGVTIADASGRLNIVAKGEPGPGGELLGLNVEVTVPRFDVTLPEQSPHDVQELDTDPTIVTGAHRGLEEFRPIPQPVEGDGKGEPELTAADPLPVRVEIRLGDEVWIRRGTELEVKLVGSAVALLRGELSVQGELRLARGEINVQGKLFEVERGVITFLDEGDPSNPTVIATAGYTAPEGTRVFAEFVGPVKTGKLSLRSEPPLRDDQILSLLLFGSPDGNFGTSTGGDPASTAALAAGGSVVTRGLNQELRKLTSLDIQTRIGEHEGEPQPEVAVQISPRLTAELGYTVQAPNPGRSQDRTHVTLDLRLLRNWSLSTTIGDAGSFLLDLLWRHRY